MRTALILGVTGQTGAYLSHRLVNRNIQVVGTSRNYSEANLWRLQRLGVEKKIEHVSLSLHDTAAIRKTLAKYRPDEIYYLAGPSSVAASFREPMVSMDQIVQPVVSFLEVLKDTESSAHFFNAASTDCFGNQPGVVLDETSALQPLSPYAVAKSAAFWTVKNYRDSFGVRASNGILTNHESPLRGPDFVTQKIVSGLLDIVEGKKRSLALGSTSIARDWLWAGDVADAALAVSAAREPGDFVIASGKSATLQEFVDLACHKLSLDPEEVVKHDKSLFRPSDIESITLTPKKAKSELGWRAQYSLEDIVEALVEGNISPKPRTAPEARSRWP
jgi:GDPmannose 4,6-dehydratase